MYYIQHRTNSIESVKSIPKEWGAEIDIRYHENNLVLTHDPFNHHTQKLLTLNEFLKNWQSTGPLILNVKTEGVELECIRLINEYKVPNWFFLDISMPYLVKYSKLAYEKTQAGFSIDNLAVRFSDKEPIEYALAFSGKSSWVWVDWFDQIVLTKENQKKLKQAQFKLCLVSPELQNKPLEMISEYKNYLLSYSIDVDAVCTKRPDLWM
jgi:hypothetical protein